MDEQRKVRFCKFGGNIECTRTDRGRADCCVCGAVRAALSTYSRLLREQFELVGECNSLRIENKHLQAELIELRVKCDRLAQERDKACHQLELAKRQATTVA